MPHRADRHQGLKAIRLMQLLFVLTRLLCVKVSAKVADGLLITSKDPAIENGCLDIFRDSSEERMDISRKSTRLPWWRTDPIGRLLGNPPESRLQSRLGRIGACKVPPGLIGICSLPRSSAVTW